MIKMVFGETLAYFLFAGMVFAAITLILLLCLLAILITRGRKAYMQKAKYILAFALALFANGAAGNALWVALFTNTAYVSKDPLIFFVPIIPFGWWALCQTCGSHLINNFKMWHLQLVWLVMAGITWGMSLAIVHKSMKKGPNQGVQRDAGWLRRP